jgi:hypothetical protein
MKKFKLNLSQLTSGVILPILILVLAGSVYFLVLPRYAALRNLRNVLESKREAAAIRAAQFKDIQSLVQDFQKKKDDLKVVDEALPPAPRIPELLANLEYLAKQSGMSVDNIQITTAQTLGTLGMGKAVGQVKRAEKLLSATQGLGIMQVDVNVVGLYESLKSFLLNLEQNLRLFDVQALSVSEASAKEQTRQFSFRLQTYYQKQL